MASKIHLKDLYVDNENPLRKISTDAKAVEAETQISTVLGNVGNPSGPTLAKAKTVMARYDQRGLTSDYNDHTGDANIRRATANALNTIARINDDNHPDKFTKDGIFFVPGGTGGLNTVISIFKEPIVLTPDPFYPPWEPISTRNNATMDTYPLHAADDYLLDKSYEEIREKLTKIQNQHPKKPVLLMYHYPHNPSGKVLDKEDAARIGDTLNKLVAEFPQLYLVQEDLYLATTASNLGIYTPMEHLSHEAMKRTLMIHSPSKEGLGQVRGAIVATTDTALAAKLTPVVDREIRKSRAKTAPLGASLRGTTAFNNLGISTAAALGTLTTLTNIAKGIDPEPANADKTAPDRNHRYVTADFYQERMKAAGQGFVDLQKALPEANILDNHALAEGTYYLWPSLKCLEDKPIPEAFRSLKAFEGKEKIENTRDVFEMLLHADLLGLRPITIAPGELFTRDNKDMRVRFAAVSHDIQDMHEAANTFKGVIGKAMGLDLDALGVVTRTKEELQAAFPPAKAANKLIDPEAAAWAESVYVRSGRKKDKQERDEALEARGGMLIPPGVAIHESRNDKDELVITLTLPLIGKIKDLHISAASLARDINDTFFPAETSPELTPEMIKNGPTHATVKPVDYKVVITFPHELSQRDYALLDHIEELQEARIATHAKL